MRRHHATTAISALALLALAAPLTANPQEPVSDATILATSLIGFEGNLKPTSFKEALAQGRHWVNQRLRAENVDDATMGRTRDTTALTLRTVLGYESATYNGWSVMIEAEDVSAVGDDSYDSTLNGNTDRAVVADPDGTEVNRASLSYAGLADTTFVLGRQRIVLNNSRFVGNVGWRQNEQTYDAYTVVNTAMEDLTLAGSYIYNINNVKAGDIGTAAIALNAAYDVGEAGTLVGYYLELDNDSGAAALSSGTVGVSWDGRMPTGGNQFVYRVEFANQTDVGENPNTDLDASYLNLEVGMDFDGTLVSIGSETLEGTGVNGEQFQTPLATGHKFNGWADRFLATPQDGLEDLYLSVGTEYASTNFKLAYHMFSADEGGTDFGTELDLLASRKLACGAVAGIKFADFSADSDGGMEDITKAWIWIAYSF
ncbi:MAG: hypothetical protein ACI8QC_004562 [Planctomycetota bacterium]|jgi:hypothetical protein